MAGRTSNMWMPCLLFPLVISSVFAQSCAPIGNTPGCTCRLDDSSVIDLSSLGYTDGTARYFLIASDVISDVNNAT